MKDLRERAEQLMAHWNTQEIEDNRKNMTGDLESFAREIRNETLEEAALRIEESLNIYSDWKTLPNGCIYNAHVLIKARDDIRVLALAAKESK